MGRTWAGFFDGSIPDRERVRHGGAEHRVDARSVALLQRLDFVKIRVRRNADRRVTKRRGDRLEVCAGRERDGRVAVTQVVQPNLLQLLTSHEVGERPRERVG